MEFNIDYDENFYFDESFNIKFENENNHISSPDLMSIQVFETKSEDTTPSSLSSSGEKETFDLFFNKM